MHIALLEDDPAQTKLMEVWLDISHHKCSSFATGQAFIDALKRETFDLLIIDWMLPDIPGDQVLRWVRQNLGWQIPVLFATGRDEEEAIASILKLGADDYMTKPVKHLELMARIEALERRSNASKRNAERLQYGNIEVDLDARRVRLSGQEADMTQKEFELAAYMLKNSGRLLSRVDLLEQIWGLNSDVDTRTVDTHISRLRKKLHLVPENGWRLTPVYGYGYRLEPVNETEKTDH